MNAYTATISAVTLCDGVTVLKGTPHEKCKLKKKKTTENYLGEVGSSLV